MDLFDLLKKFRASKTEEEDASVYDVFEVKECWTARHWGVPDPIPNHHLCFFRHFECRRP